MLRELSLFSGIGGFSLGLERAGFATPVAFVEIDPFCQRVLAKHWPGVPIHGDITTREFTEGEADVITGGFPCQDISFAGAGAGLAGARSGLYRHIIRAIRVVRPRVAILENVAALLCGGLGTVLGDLAEVGHDAEWHCIPASAVGAPHRRDRVWIIAERDELCPTPEA
jgi:DNA (cytosine-5)-methyltransferase 1